MPFDKSQIYRGAFITAGGGLAHQPKLPRDLREFDQANATANAMAQADLTGSLTARQIEIKRLAARLHAVRAGIEAVRKPRK